MTDRNELERLQPMTTEEKALALVNAVLVDVELPTVMLGEFVSNWVWEHALLAAIEHHEAELREQAERFSEAAAAAKALIETWFGNTPEEGALAADFLSPFILPEPEPDPLVEARRQIADRVLRQYGAPASDEDCIGLIVAALEEQAKIERIEQ